MLGKVQIILPNGRLMVITMGTRQKITLNKSLVVNESPPRGSFFSLWCFPKFQNCGQVTLCRDTFVSPSLPLNHFSWNKKKLVAWFVSDFVKGAFWELRFSNKKNWRVGGHPKKKQTKGADTPGSRRETFPVNYLFVKEKRQTKHEHIHEVTGRYAHGGSMYRPWWLNDLEWINKNSYDVLVGINRTSILFVSYHLLRCIYN